MANNDKVIFVLIDALRSDYISKYDSPFLYDFTKKNTYYRRVTQKRSYCERAEIFSGLNPDESGYFTAIGYSPETSPFKSISIFLDFFSYFDKLIFKYKYLRSFRNKLIMILTRSETIKMRPYSIPSKILKYFSLTEDEYDFRDKRAFDGNNNLLVECKEQGINIFYDAFTALNFDTSLNDQQRIELLESNLNNNFKFYPLYLGVLDTSAHIHGPDSNERRVKLKDLDKRLSEFYKKTKSKFPNTKFIFLGDHGMTEVKKYIDVKNEIKKMASQNNLILGNDYIFFLDSTIVRIWYLNEIARFKMEKSILSNQLLLDNGEFINEEIAKREKIPFPNRKYGDTLWMAKLGILIFPDFFHIRNPYKGMHGYDVNHYSSKGTCIVESSEDSIVEDIELRDLYGILKKQLGI